MSNEERNLSYVPFATQIDTRPTEYQNTQDTQRDAATMVFVHSDKMTELQVIRMKQCQEILRANLNCIVRQVHDLDGISFGTRKFVLPYRSDDICEKIRKKFDRPMVYLPKAVLEARAQNEKLPNRSLVSSLIMSESQIFIVKSCDSIPLRKKINEMMGRLVKNFDDIGLNVVLTNRADDKYCARAFKRNIPVVSLDWVNDMHKKTLSDDPDCLNQNAMKFVKDHQIKPFYGLYFRVMVKNLSPELKCLITDNQGHIIYGERSIYTHIIDNKYVDPTSKYAMNDSRRTSTVSTEQQNKSIKIVDEHFLFTCAKLGYYLTNSEYQEYLSRNSNVIIKQEIIENSPISSCRQENYTPPQTELDLMNDSFESIDGSYNRQSLSTSTSVNNTILTTPPSMLPPPTITTTAPRSHKKHKHKQIETESDMILRALNTFDTAQTQHASTQMRRLPDPQLKIEETIEPSQQLYWVRDDCDRRRRAK